MSRIRLTPTRIVSLTCDKTQSFLWDSEVPGLGVRATPSGKKTFIYQSRLNGKSLRMTLKEVGALTLEDARSDAREFSSLIAKGVDPREHKRKLDEENKAAKRERKEKQAREALLECRVEKAWSEYMDERKPYWGERHYSDHLKLAQRGGGKVKRGKGTLKQGPLFPLMKMYLGDLSADGIEKWLKKEVAERPGPSRLSYSLLKAFINWCSIHPVYSAIVSSDILTRKVMAVLPKKNARQDSLQREQLQSWFDAVQQIQNPVISAFLQALLLTGARREELAGLRWEDCDFRWKSLTIRDKVEDTRVIPMTPYVERLLQWLPKRNEWVFSSPRAKSGRIQEPRIAHNKALLVAGLNDLTLHGLRRSFGSLSEWVEVPTGIVAQVMGHKPSATAERHYRVRPLDLLRMWHVKIEEWILEQAGIYQPIITEKTPTFQVVAGKK